MEIQSRLNLLYLLDWQRWQTNLFIYLFTHSKMLIAYSLFTINNKKCLLYIFQPQYWEQGGNWGQNRHGPCFHGAHSVTSIRLASSSMWVDLKKIHLLSEYWSHWYLRLMMQIKKQRFVITPPTSKSSLLSLPCLHAFDVGKLLLSLSFLILKWRLEHLNCRAVGRGIINNNSKNSGALVLYLAAIISSYCASESTQILQDTRLKHRGSDDPT